MGAYGAGVRGGRKRWRGCEERTDQFAPVRADPSPVAPAMGAAEFGRIPTGRRGLPHRPGRRRRPAVPQVTSTTGVPRARVRRVARNPSPG
ncbi:hypothetical protein GCM10014713_40060 [Streptomyces purpureus]|uniref:Uncharacterized protein n=1 Tax=Streptomyces purpureus TaxID=1951 RepID=A0A918H6G3_9ACTN|nr:hypothetical protein GCM10014713_40060 [Streptomyces purpureus]